MELYKSTYFEVLEIGMETPPHEITKAYERAKMTYSADNPALYTVFSGDEVKEILQVIEEAYTILGNTSYRARYLEKIRNPETKAEELEFKALIGGYAPAKTDRNRPSFKPNYQISGTMEDEIKGEKIFDGSFLKKVRDYKQISIEKLSEITRVGVTYIIAIEKNDYRSLPAPVFVRGFVVQIARVLGLDTTKTADSFVKIMKTHIENH